MRIPLATALCLLLTLSATHPGHAVVLRPGSPSALCREAIGAAERAYGVPDRLMQAIGIVESGRPDERGGTTAWPWTINVEGVGEVFETKEAAIAAVNAHRAQGARSIDVGCMQVNLMHHPDAFGSLDEAFDPAANARYAAQFLQKLLAQTGSWPHAAAAYHSLTPDIGADYARKVLAVWARPGLGVAGFAPSFATASAASSAPVAPTAGSMAISGGMTAHILPLSSAPPGMVVGRGLAAYRAAPTQLAASTLTFRRF